MKRKEGYYWVKFNPDGNWSIARYESEYDWWYVFGNDNLLSESDFCEIDERKIERVNP